MSETATRDGVLAVHPDHADQFTIQHAPGTISSEFIKLLREGDPAAKLFSRSVYGQMGIDFVPVGRPVFTRDRQGVTVHSPVEAVAYTELAENIVSNLATMRNGKKPGAPLRQSRRGETVKGGRYVNFNQYHKLDKTEVEDAINQSLLAIDIPNDDSYREKRHYKVNDDGSVTMPIALVETLVNDFTLSTKDSQLNAIKHGRAGLRTHTDTVRRDYDDILPDFFVGGIALSPGPFTCVIRECLDKDGKVRQLPGASAIDGDRLMGISLDELDLYTGHRQIEVINLDEARKFGDTEVTIDLYSDINPDLNPIIDWYNMDIETRRRIHQAGASPLEVLQLSNPNARRQIFEAYRGKAGVVMSSHGASAVPQGKTDKLTADNVQSVAVSFGRDRKLGEELQVLEPYVKALSPAGDRSRIYAGDRLLARDMTRLVEGGDIRSFFVKDFGNVAMSQQVHSQLVDLVREGVSLGWDNDSDMRVFHRSGMWLRPEEVSQMGEVDICVAMYGTHRSQIDEKLLPQIDKFMALLPSLMPARKIAITHGNGPGVMRISDVLARKYGMKSWGIGIEVEGQDEGKDIWLPSGTAFFKNSERLYRQQIMDRYRGPVIINPGGYGTLEEVCITACTNKLSGAIPAPTILVDPSGDYYDSVVEMFKKVSNRKILPMYGEDVDITDSPLGQPWVANTIHHVKNYDFPDPDDKDFPESAFSIIEEYWRDPVAYWTKAQISTDDVANGYKAQSDQYALMGLRVSSKMRQAVIDYCGVEAVIL